MSPFLVLFFFSDSISNSHLLPLNFYLSNCYFSLPPPMSPDTPLFKSGFSQISTNSCYKEILQDSSLLIYRIPPETLFLPTLKYKLIIVPKVIFRNSDYSYSYKQLCSVGFALYVCGSEFMVRSAPLRGFSGVVTPLTHDCII